MILLHISKKLLNELGKRVSTRNQEREISSRKFVEKYVIDGEAKVIPVQYPVSKSKQLKDFFRNHHNIKTRLVLICLMENKILKKEKLF